MVFVISFFLAGCDKKDPDVVGRVGLEYEVEMDDLISFFEAEYYYKKYADKSLTDYETALKDMLINRVKLLDFFESGFHEDSLIIGKIRRIVNEELVIRYYDTQYHQKYLNDKAVTDLYNRLSREVVYRKISITKEGSSSNAVTKAKVAEVMAKIDEGGSFEELAKEYSNHKSTAVKGGLMPALTLQGNPDNMSRLIFDMQEHEVQSFETDKTFEIIRIEEINTLPIAPLEELKESILEQLNDDFTDLAVEEYDNVFTGFVDTSSIQWNLDALAQIRDWFDPGGFDERAYLGAVEKALSEGQNFTIMEYSAGEVDLSHYYKLLRDVLLLNSYSAPTIEELKAYLTEAVRTEHIVQEALALDLEKDILSLNTKSDVLRDNFIQLYDQEIMRLHMPEVTDNALHLFYDENKDSLFFQFAKINIHAAITSDETSAKELMKKLDQGVQFQNLTARIFVKTFIQDHDGKVLAFRSKEKPFLGEAAFTLDLNEVTGPVEYDDPEKGKQFAIIKCVGNRPAKQLQYSEVKKAVHEEYVKYQSLKILNEKEEALLEKHDAEIYKVVLEQQMAEI